VNKKVEVSGKIVGLAVGSGEGKFVVIIADEDGTKINVNVTNNPYRRLLDSATAVGTYNGDSLDNGKII
jgi:DNA/RNA endonuclease YhcR with UshA esterase domain